MNRLAILFLMSFQFAACAQYADFDEMVHNTISFSVDTISPRNVDYNSMVLLDVRESNESDISMIKNAIHVNPNGVVDYADQYLTKSDTIVVYCSIGYRSEKAAEHLRKSGYEHVYNLYGGIFLWNNEGYKVVDPKDSVTDRIHGYNESWSKWIERGEIVLD